MRNRIVVGLANFILRFATKRYRDLLEIVIHDGMVGLDARARRVIERERGGA